MRIDARRRKAARRSLAMAAVAALLWGCTEPSSPGSPSPASGKPGAPGEFKRCCFEVQIDTAGEFSSQWGGAEYADIAGPHQLTWRWTARELVEYREWTYSDGRLDQQLRRPTVLRDTRLVLVRRAEANVAYEASSDLFATSPSQGRPPYSLGACRARIVTNGFRGVLDSTVDRHIADHALLDDRFLHFHSSKYDAEQPVLLARLFPKELGEVAGDCNTAGSGGPKNEHYTGKNLQHEMQGPWEFELARPTREQLRTGTHFEVSARNQFDEKMDVQQSPLQAVYPHGANGFYQVKVTFTFVPPAQVEQSAGKWTDVPPLGGGAPGADLALAVRTAAGPVPVGAGLVYTLAVTNKGPGTAVGTVLTDNLPAGVRFISATPSRGSCSATKTVVCNLADLEKGSSATVVIAIAPTAAGTLINSAKVMSSVPDINPADNSATSTTHAD